MSKSVRCEPSCKVTFHPHQRVQIHFLSNERTAQKSRATEPRRVLALDSFSARTSMNKAADRRPTYLHTRRFGVWGSEAATGHSAGQTADGCGQGVSRPRAATAALQTKPSLGACVFMTPESRVTAAPAASGGSQPCTQPRSRLFKLDRRPSDMSTLIRGALGRQQDESPPH